MKLVLVTLLLIFGNYHREAQQSNLYARHQEPDTMKGMVDRHNKWRQEAGVKPLAWSPALANFAQVWATHLAKKGCEMEHRPPKGKWGRNGNGENIYWSSGIQNKPAEVVDNWASEIKYYNNKTGACKGGVCGHYTQLVWKNTTQVGCGMAKCGNEEIWVCNYSPAGNWEGEKAY